MDYTCTICGAKGDADHYFKNELTPLMETEHICFHCAYWRYRQEAIKAGDNRFALDNRGNFYHVANLVTADTPTDHEWARGFGGSKVKLVYADGRTIYTNNLWGNGSPPAWFTEWLPANYHAELTWID